MPVIVLGLLNVFFLAVGLFLHWPSAIILVVPIVSRRPARRRPKAARQPETSEASEAWCPLTHRIDVDRLST